MPQNNTPSPEQESRELRAALNKLHGDILGTHGTNDSCIDKTLALITHQNRLVAERIKAALPEKFNKGFNTQVLPEIVQDSFDNAVTQATTAIDGVIKELKK
jgi:hypothetical protein